MRRRSYIHGIGAASVLALAGCTTKDDGTVERDDPTPTRTATSSPTPTESTQQEVLIDKTIYTTSRYPFDLSEGQTLHIEVDVKRGGPLVVDVANTDAGESIFSDTVKTTKTLDIPIENDGTHYVTFQGMDEASIRVVLIKKST